MKVRSTLLVAVLVAAIAPTTARSDDDSDGKKTKSVQQYGAVCNGSYDDTRAFQKAVASTPTGGMLTVAAGKCVLTDTVVINRPMTLAGTGFGSQILGKTDKTLIQARMTHNVVIRDLFLGSSSNAPGVSLLELSSTHRSQISGIIMAGGNYGLHLYGSLLNTVTDLRSATNNIVPFFAPTAVNQTWVMAEVSTNTGFPGVNHYSANANTFIAPVLEGGVNGIWLRDGLGEGSLNIVGGTIEGVSGVGLKFEKTFLPSSVTGTHFEANGKDIVIEDSSNIRLASILSINGIQLIDHPTSGIYSKVRNIAVTDSVIEQITIPASTKRILLQNITTGVAQAGPTYGPTHIDNQNPATVRVNIGNYAGGE